MRRARCSAVTACMFALAVIAACARSESADQGTAMAPRGTAAGIDSLRNSYQETYNRRDASTLANMWAEDAVNIMPNGKTNQGRAAIQASWPIDTVMWGTITITPDKPATIVDNLAWETGSFNVQMSQRGRMVTVPTRYLVLLRHNGSGWKLQAGVGVVDSAAMAAQTRRPAAR